MGQIGKLMQVTGLVILPLSMFLQLSGAIPGVGRMLGFLILGATSFWIGRIVEGYSPRA